MGGLDLPVVAPGTLIVDALSAMVARKRMACAMSVPGGTLGDPPPGPFTLITAIELENADKCGATTVDEAGGTQLPPAPPDNVVVALIDRVTGGSAGAALATALGYSVSHTIPDYASGPAFLDTLVVITSFESRADKYVAGYICDGKRPNNGRTAPHIFDALPATPNHACTRCTTPNGQTPPTVHAF